MITGRESDGDFCIDFHDYETWESFDSIIEILSSKFEINIVEKIDGPESRVWKLWLDDMPLTLHNNPYGNFLKANSSDSIEYLKQIFPLIKDLFY